MNPRDAVEKAVQMATEKHLVGNPPKTKEAESKILKDLEKSLKRLKDLWLFLRFSRDDKP